MNANERAVRQRNNQYIEAFMNADAAWFHWRRQR